MESDNQSISPVIKNALEFMKNNEEYSFRDVARYCNVSLSRLYEIFQKNLGKTPNDIRQEIQCKNAVHLLTTTNLSVEEISSRLHFSPSSYFRKTLRKHMGKTPLAIRKESQFNLKTPSHKRIKIRLCDNLQYARNPYDVGNHLICS